MGRTIKPARYEIDAQLNELKQFVRALRKEDIIYFESLYADVKKHISSISYANPLNPNELMQWSAIIELKKEISKIKNDIMMCISEKQQKR